MDFLSFLLILASTIAGVTTDIYQPAIYEIQKEFVCKTSAVQMSIGLNFLIPSIMGLFYGPLSDSIGRRPVFITGMLVHFISTLGILFSNKIEIFNLFRMIQGGGSCALFLISTSIFFEHYEQKTATQLISYSGTAFSSGIILAPILGGFLTQYFGWRSCFIMIAILSLGSLIAIFKLLPETIPLEKRRIFHFKEILSDYYPLISNWKNMSYHLILSLLVGVNFIFVVTVPLVFISKQGMSPTHFAFFQSTAPLVGISLTFLARRIIITKGVDLLLRLGIGCALIGTVFMMISVLISDDNPFLVIFSYVIFTALFPFLFPSVICKTISIFPDQKGSGSSLGYSMRSLTMWMGSIVGSIIFDGSLLPAVSCMLIISIITFIIYILNLYER